MLTVRRPASGWVAWVTALLLVLGVCSGGDGDGDADADGDLAAAPDGDADGDGASPHV